MKLSIVLALTLLSTLIIGSDAFFNIFGGNSSNRSPRSNGCNDCGTFLGCLLCGRILGPSAVGRRKRSLEHLNEDILQHLD
ncbi:hypothetical protein TCAL_16181 [Tigriopus californicus]|uniref:Uncharacterized protein n=1 Tax=Tigriopus californicus TaxID=6832 RepID=A0A553P4V9_TIGCA|nr:hypothetical protein TCAL_16181 [Tigriopus californicus]